MVPPDKDVLGVRMHIDTEPPSAPKTFQPVPTPSALPPASAKPEDACIIAVRRRAEAAEAKIALAEAKAAEFERQLRVHLEARAPGPYQAPLERLPAPAPIPAPAPAAESDSVRPDGTAVSLRKAQTKFYMQLAGFITIVAIPFGGWLVSMFTAANSNEKSDKAVEKSDVAKTIAERVEVKFDKNAKTCAEVDEEFHQYRSNMRELMRLQGVDIPAHDGDKAPNDLKPYAPLCPPGKVCSGPQLILTKPP